MFQTSGYFKAVTCPYFMSGLCERPYCHFRHVKPTSDEKSSVSSLWSNPVALSTASGSGYNDNSSLLAKVGETIQKLQRDIERDQQLLNGHKTVRPKSIEAFAGTVADKFRSRLTLSDAKSSDSRNPVEFSYEPTPISELERKRTAECKTLGENTKENPNVIDTEEEYEPQPKKSKLHEFDEEQVGKFGEGDSSQASDDEPGALFFGKSKESSEKEQGAHGGGNVHKTLEESTSPGDILSRIIHDSDKSLNLTNVKHKNDGSMVILEEKKNVKKKPDSRKEPSKLPTAAELFLELSDEEMESVIEFEKIVEEPPAYEVPQIVEEQKPTPEELAAAKKRESVWEMINSGTIVLGHIHRNDEPPEKIIERRVEHKCDRDSHVSNSNIVLEMTRSDDEPRNKRWSQSSGKDRSRNTEDSDKKRKRHGEEKVNKYVVITTEKIEGFTQDGSEINLKRGGEAQQKDNETASEISRTDDSSTSDSEHRSKRKKAKKRKKRQKKHRKEKRKRKKEKYRKHVSESESESCETSFGEDSGKSRAREHKRKKKRKHSWSGDSDVASESLHGNTTASEERVIVKAARGETDSGERLIDGDASTVDSSKERLTVNSVHSQSSSKVTTEKLRVGENTDLNNDFKTPHDSVPSTETPSKVSPNQRQSGDEKASKRGSAVNSMTIKKPKAKTDKSVKVAGEFDIFSTMHEGTPSDSSRSSDSSIPVTIQLSSDCDKSNRRHFENSESFELEEKNVADVSSIGRFLQPPAGATSSIKPIKTEHLAERLTTNRETHKSASQYSNRKESDSPGECASTSHATFLSGHKSNHKRDKSSRSRDTAKSEHGMNISKHSDPGREKSEHGRNESDPRRGKSDPVKERSEQGVEKTDPGREKSEHGRKKSEHGMEKSEHGKEKSEHGMGKSEHGRKKSEHDRKKSDPGREELDHGRGRSESGKEKSEHSAEKSDRGREKSDRGREKSDHGRQKSEHGTEYKSHPARKKSVLIGEKPDPKMEKSEHDREKSFKYGKKSDPCTENSDLDREESEHKTRRSEAVKERCHRKQSSLSSSRHFSKVQCHSSRPSQVVQSHRHSEAEHEEALKFVSELTQSRKLNLEQYASRHSQSSLISERRRSESSKKPEIKHLPGTSKMLSPESTHRSSQRSRTISSSSRSSPSRAGKSPEKTAIASLFGEESSDDDVILLDTCDDDPGSSVSTTKPLFSSPIRVEPSEREIAAPTENTSAYYVDWDDDPFEVTNSGACETKRAAEFTIPKKRVAHLDAALIRAPSRRAMPSPQKTFLSPAEQMHNRLKLVQQKEMKMSAAASSTPRHDHSGSESLNASTKARVAHTAKWKTERDKRTPVQTSKFGSREAHVPKAKVLARPIIPSEFGCKVATNIRQRYLNQLIDECLKIYNDQQAAFDRALHEEKYIYQRSSSRVVYLNVAVKAIRVLRTEVASQAGTSCQPRLNRTWSHEAVLGGAKAAKTTFTLHRSGHGNIKDQREVNLTPDVFSQYLQQYILTEDQLRENGFPMVDPENPHLVKFCGGMDKTPTKGLKLHEKICSRCGKRFRIYPDGSYGTNEECFYHWGRAYKRKVSGQWDSRYMCCSGDLSSEPCCVGKYHVHDTNKSSDLENYVKTYARPPTSDGYGVYALDCEMVYTVAGCELARVTVIDMDMEPIYESLVKPSSEVIDYNTRFSGLEDGSLDRVETTIADVQNKLRRLFSERTTLIGHSLESDFTAMKLIHPTAVDTSVVFPHRLGPPYKRALKNLMGEILKKIIQNNVGGHDSHEDAAACMELMIWKVKEELRVRH